MTSPYKKYLQVLLDSTVEVRIDRDGAPSVDGTVKEVEDDACVIQSRDDNPELVRVHYIAYDDIRGVSRLDHNYDIIG